MKEEEEEEKEICTCRLTENHLISSPITPPPSEGLVLRLGAQQESYTLLLISLQYIVAPH